MGGLATAKETAPYHRALLQIQIQMAVGVIYALAYCLLYNFDIIACFKPHLVFCAGYLWSAAGVAGFYFPKNYGEVSGAGFVDIDTDF